jgi:hypothetical protein
MSHFTDQSFERAQQLYDQQEPPDFYDYPYCQEFQEVYSVDPDEMAELARDGCRKCPFKHRCHDGVRAITTVLDWAHESAEAATEAEDFFEQVLHHIE